MLSLKKPPTLKAVLLDAGNTLIFLDHEVLGQVARRNGLDIDAATLRAEEAHAKRAYEKLLREGGSHDDGWMLFMEQVFAHAGAPKGTLRTLAEAAWQQHMAFRLWCRVPEGTTQAIERLRDAGIVVGVISNAEGQVAEQLRRSGVAPYLDLVVDSGIEGVRKPDPEIFRRALSRLSLPAEACIYVGDIPEVDVEGARAAGIEAVLIDPFGHYRDYDAAPRVTSVAELVDRLLS